MTFLDFKSQYHICLNPQQDAAAQAVNGPVLLLAVPGSGKTTVLVARLGYMVYGCNLPPESILTMTYTVSATKDMCARFSALFHENATNKLEFRTINGISSMIIRHYERTLGRKAFNLLEHAGRQAAMIGEISRRITNTFVTESTIKAIQTTITYVKNSMLSPKEQEAIDLDGIAFFPIYQEYCNRLREQNLMDYDDQLVYAFQILRKYPDILHAFQERYRYFCVDEAQDTSKIQHAIINLLANQSQNLFMVGDEDQSIYGFRAAYPTALMEFEQNYPKATLLFLEQNYRSTPEIVGLANYFIKQNENRRPKQMTAVNGSGKTPTEIPVHDRREQYAYLVKIAADCETETAVLYRDNDSALPLIDLLNRAGISYRCRQVDGTFFTHRVVHDISDIICLAKTPHDGDCFMRVYCLYTGVKTLAFQAKPLGQPAGDNDFKI